MGQSSWLKSPSDWSCSSQPSLRCHMVVGTHSPPGDARSRQGSGKPHLDGPSKVLVTMCNDPSLRVQSNQRSLAGLWTFTRSMIGALQAVTTPWSGRKSATNKRQRYMFSTQMPALRTSTCARRIRSLAAVMQLRTSMSPERFLGSSWIMLGSGVSSI